MNKVVNESLRKICHYQQNLLQHYYLLDILVIKLKRHEKCLNRPLMKEAFFIEMIVMPLFPSVRNKARKVSSVYKLRNNNLKIS